MPLHRRVVRNELTLETATRLLENLLATGIELQEPPQLHSRAMETGKPSSPGCGLRRPLPRSS